MGNITLDAGQIDAISQMHNGCILNGGVGSGKSRTALTYYYISIGGKLMINKCGKELPPAEPRDLYIITTAKKRDTHEWEEECVPFPIISNGIKVTIDSWNNITKYKDVYGAFFIFDEQRVVGSGTWVKTFYKIAKKNKWILLSATPGDDWTDYIPVFVANGFYKNKTDFQNRHVVWNQFTNFPSIKGFYNTRILEEYKKNLLIDIECSRHTIRHHDYYICNYDKKLYLDVWKTRQDPETCEPFINASALCYCWRKIVNRDPSREVAILEIIEKHPRVIIFYNFDYELEILRNLCSNNNINFTEWNGHKHQQVLEGDKWAYLVQYTSGSEGWNCITTNTIIFYSQNYSYKIMEQACGRIDRRNTSYVDLYYYHLRSKSPIDLKIKEALEKKKKFNEKKFIGKLDHYQKG